MTQTDLHIALAQAEAKEEALLSEYRQSFLTKKGDPLALRQKSAAQSVVVEGLRFQLAEQKKLEEKTRREEAAAEHERQLQAARTERVEAQQAFADAKQRLERAESELEAAKRTYERAFDRRSQAREGLQWFCSSC